MLPDSIVTQKKDWNLNNEFNLSKRYTWIDPANGMDMTSKSYINEFGSDYAINRLNEINAGASIFNPASITQIPLLDWAVEDGAFLRVNNISIGYIIAESFRTKTTNAECAYLLYRIQPLLLH